MTEPKRRTKAKSDLATLPAEAKRAAAAFAGTPDAERMATTHGRERVRGRDRIRVDSMVDKLQDDADGKITLTLGQRRSIEILLDRALPRLQSTTISGDPDGAPIENKWTVEFVNPTRKG